MTGLVRKAILLAVCGLLLVAATALAGVPVPAKCTFPGSGGSPAFIKVVGYAGIIPDSRGTFTINIRDGGNFPVVNSLVQLNFSACSDLKLCKTDPDSVACLPAGNGTVWKHTDSNGNAVFTVIGGAINTGAVAGPGLGCITMTADYVLLGTATAVDFDENGALGGGNNGVTASDFVPLLRDWGAGAYWGRSDFNLSGPPIITAADFVPWLRCWGDGSSLNGCTTTYCP